MARRMSGRVCELLGERAPFVHATVVRAQSPTSTRPGDDAVILADGTVEGFVGGQCAAESVRTAALGALETGETVLLRILPDGETGFPESLGSHAVVNPCLSGGALEIFLEPLLPSPLIQVVGATPIADAVAALAGSVGFSARAVGTLESDPVDGTVAVIVASHGRNEVESIRAALDAGVGFIGLVASVKRGASVLGAMELTKEERERIHAPVGLDIGARTAEEIGLSIIGAVVRAVRIEGLTATSSGPLDQPVLATDPVCGMTVVIGPETPRRVVDGVDQWFCSPACRDH